MNKVLIFSGTTEGRMLAGELAKAGISVDVAVATEYGQMVMQEDEHIKVLTGRMDVEDMRGLIGREGYAAVIDATHPYATLVTDNIRESMEGMELPYIRLLRQCESNGLSNFQCFEDTEACVKALKATKGRIMLTTGSKELSAYTADSELRERIVARVLPGMESLNLCYRAGLKGEQIIAMQGPFSREMNEALIREYDISLLVTKESGKTGGLDEKLEACESTGTTCYVVKRSGQSDVDGLDEKEVIEKLEAILEVSIAYKPKVSVLLAGIGMGNRGSRTIDVDTAIEKADIIFGAERMLSGIKTSAVKYPYYLASDIIPVLKKVTDQAESDIEAVVLFSGDSGFFSGAAKLYQELKKDENFEVAMLPGISTVSAMAAGCGISWQDLGIVSTHGVPVDQWESEICHRAQYDRGTFLLTSGEKDVRHIGELIEKLDDDSKSSIRIYIGRNLSYDDESLELISIEDMCGFEVDGLIACIIVNDSPKKFLITPSIADEDFIRDKVPMTKEDIRHLSICRLGLTRDSVVYDIGAGTGSLSIEMARLSPQIMVYAVESEELAVGLICKNKEKFALDNVKVIHALAPDGLSELPKADCAFIGGSRGNLKAILDKLQDINPKMRVVLNAVSMETICEMNDLLKTYNTENVDITQIAVSRTKILGGYNMLQGGNPVFVFSFNFA